MKIVNIRVTNFEFSSITAFEISRSINDHATVMISGIVKPNLEDSHLKMKYHASSPRVIGTDENGEEKLLFCGNISSMELTKTNQLNMLTIRLISASGDMDQLPQTRSYQESSITYEEILKSFQYYNEYAFIMAIKEHKNIATMLVQYQETDWAFVKRLASNIESFVVPDCITGGVKFYFGFPYIAQKGKLESDIYEVKKEINEYVYKKNHGLPEIQEHDSTYFIVKNRETYDLCQPVIFQDKELYIHHIQSILEGQELQHFYTLKSKGGFRTNRFYNEQIAGASLAGKVLDVHRDSVKVQLYVDENNEASEPRWLPYTTVYSAPDGIGWYAMPEIGDTVRIYFPSEIESEGFVISAVPSLDSSCQFRSNPNEKSLRNIHKKEVLLTPNKIVMTNNKGMSITLDDKMGIFIESNKSISLHSNESINMVSSNSSICVTGSTEVKITQNQSSIELKDEVFFQGTEVHIQ